MVDPLEEVRRRRLIIDRVDAWLYEEIEPYLGHRVLEVGSGHGNLVHHLLDRELVVATDIDPASVRLLSARFAEHVQVRTKVYDICDSVDEELDSFHLDTVISINVLEHIEDDVKALSNMADILWPAGRVVLIVPAHRWLYGTMDRSIGHFRRYTKKTMAGKLEMVGLVVERQFYINVAGALGWFVNGRLLRQVVPPCGQLAWFNRIVPFLSRLERRWRPPIGVSLVSVAYRS